MRKCRRNGRREKQVSPRLPVFRRAVQRGRTKKDRFLRAIGDVAAAFSRRTMNRTEFTAFRELD